MDLKKIGAYIASKRKEKELTQREVAELLKMSDKSVSKWERGICLPDVSVYLELCNILGISIHEFLAGEDIPEEEVLKTSEENIIRVSKDSKSRLGKLKNVVLILGACIILLSILFLYSLQKKDRDLDTLTPLDPESVEMLTADTLSPNGAFIYDFKTTKDRRLLNLHVDEFHGSSIVNRHTIRISSNSNNPVEEGQIIILPRVNDRVIQVILLMDGAKLVTEIPILEGKNMEPLGWSHTQIEKRIPITYEGAQGLLALIYDDQELSPGSISDYEKGISPDVNDYTYFFSFEFTSE